MNFTITTLLLTKFKVCVIMNRGAILYSRVSTKRQLYSLDHQEHFLNKFTMYKGYNVISKFRDIGSGSDITKLTGLQTIMKTIQPEQFILVRDVSRIGRNCSQVFNLVRELQANQNVVYAVNDAVSSTDISFYKAIEMAQYELESQKRNQAIAIQCIKDAGGYIGRPKYGYRVTKIGGIPKLVADESELHTIQIIKDWHNSGITIQKIVDILNREGSNNDCNESRKQWTISGVKNIIKLRYDYDDVKSECKYL